MDGPYGMTIEQVRHFKVTVERGGKDWPDVPPYRHGCPLRVERLIFQVDVDPETGQVKPSRSVEMRGRNVLKSGALGKPAMRWFRTGDPAHEWAEKYVDAAAGTIWDEPWPELAPPEA